MITAQKIKQHHWDNHTNIVPGKLYYVGMEMKKVIPYHDTKKIHEVKSFVWIEYNYSHSGSGFSYRILYDVMYDNTKTNSELRWFDSKCADLFKLGFSWSDTSGSFYLPDVWSCYWEQVNRYSKREWMGYIAAIMEAIDKKDPSKQPTA